MPTSRRGFLGQSIFALAGATTGVVTLGGCASSSSPGDPIGIPAPAGTRAASFGWSVGDSPNGSACAYFKIARELTVSRVAVDASLLPTGGVSATFSRARCKAWISRGAAPAFINGGASTGPATISADFGAISIANPASVAVNGDANLSQDVFYSAILSSWVPADGTDSAVARSVVAEPALVLNSGDYLVVGVEQSGGPGSVQLAMTLDYT